MTIASKIAKNTTYLSISSVAQKLLAFVFYIYLTAQLGEDLLGQYSFALSYTGIFVIAMNFGFVPILIREGAKDREKLTEHFQFILAVKVLFTLATLAVLYIGLYRLSATAEVPMTAYQLQLVYIATIVIVIDTFRSVFLAVMRATQQIHYEAIGQILYQLSVVGFGSLVLFMGYKAQAMMWVLVVASVVFFLYSAYVVAIKLNIKPRFRWKKHEAWRLVSLAAPFALADIFFKLNGSVDTVMLKQLVGDKYVAWYNIALKLTVTLTIIPGSFATAFFPAMSKAFVESKEQLRDIFEQSFMYLFMIAAPISVGAYMYAADIIDIAFHDFPAATPSLQLFMVSLVFLFVNYPIGNLLNAANRQTLNTSNMAIALTINVLLNIWLIPEYTYMGATFSAVVSSVILVLLGLPHVYSIVPFNGLAMSLKGLRIALAAAVMGIFIYVLPIDNILIGITLSAIVYIIAALILRVVRIEELRSLYVQLRSRF